MEPRLNNNWWSELRTPNSQRSYSSDAIEQMNNNRNDWALGQQDQAIRQQLLNDMLASGRGASSVGSVGHVGARLPNNVFETSGTEKLYINNTGNLNGSIEFHPNTNELFIYDSTSDKIVAKIKINIDSEGNPLTISVNDELINQKTISDNERGNLDDSSVSYGTSPGELQQLI